MNVLLDAYFDHNFGDDLFIECITSMYPSLKFYAFLEDFPMEILVWTQGIPNLYALPQEALFLSKDLFDAYICVGGDIFPDGGDFTKRKRWVKNVKEAGGHVLFLGFSLYDTYCEKTRSDIIELMKDADVISPRDSASAEMLTTWMPEKKISEMADLAFTGKWKDKVTVKGLLGISVREPLYADELQMDQYIGELQKVTDGYLQADPTRRVRFLCLSAGSVSDREVAQRILAGLNDSDRVEISEYDGNIEKMQEKIGQCEGVICTRLHALVSCMAMNIPFIPIVYEVKTEHILKEVGYQGNVFHFKEIGTVSTLAGNSDWMKTVAVRKDALDAYCARTGQLLTSAEELLAKPAMKNLKRNREVFGGYLEQLYGEEQAKMIREKDKQTEKLLEDLEGYREVIDELNEKNQKQFQQITDLNEQIAEITGMLEAETEKNHSQHTMISELNGKIAEQFHLVEDLNQKNSTYFLQIEDLNEKSAEQFRKIDTLNNTNATQQQLIEELNNRNAEQFQMIEDLNQKNAEQFRMITDLNTRNAELFQLIEELNRKNQEQLLMIEELNNKNKIDLEVDQPSTE